MRCENCNIVIGAEFTHAIKNNQCPACGKPIMQQSRLAAFLSLRTLLDEQITAKGVDVDKLSSLIMANFEVKQLFEKGPKSSSKKQDDEGIIESEAEFVEEDNNDDPDSEYKAKQRKEAKAILAKMRDDVLAGAVKDRYGIGGEDNLIMPDDEEEIDPFEYAQRLEKEQRRDLILSGGGGSFSRSDG